MTEPPKKSTAESIDKTATQVRIQIRMSDYKGFYDHLWAQNIAKRTTSDQKLDQVVSELLFSLKSTSNAFRLPWLTADTHARFVSGFLNVEPSLPERFVSLIRQRLLARAKTGADSDAIRQAISEASAMALQIPEKRNEEFAMETAEGAFRQYMEHPEFQFGVVGLMRNTYASLVFAYEDFVAKCVRLQLDDPELELRRTEQIRQRCIEAFGENDAETVWSGMAIRRFFEVRNALAHRGGRASEKTDPWKDQIEVVNDQIQITASDNRELFDELKYRIDQLVDRVLARPSRKPGE